MVIGFSKINIDATYLVKLSLTEVTQNIEQTLGNEIYSINYLKVLIKEVFTVLAPYQYYGLFKSFDVIRNGRIVCSVSDYATKFEMDFYKSHTTYGLGIEGVNIDASFWPEFNEQYFARCYNPAVKKTFIIPCSEIFRSCIGKYETAMVEATFLCDLDEENHELKMFNPQATKAGELTVAPNKYIHLRKEFTGKSCLPVYRYYSNLEYKKSINDTRSHIKISNYIVTPFPVKKCNHVVFRAVLLKPGIYLVLQLHSVQLENEDIKCLNFDRDNSSGENINEDTKINTEDGIRGASAKDDAPNLPTKHGPINPLLPTLNFANYESANDEYEKSIKIEEVKKEFKKTIRERTKMIVADPNTKGFGDPTGTDRNNNKKSHSAVILNFKNALTELIKPLIDLNYFLSVKHYLGQEFHALTEDSHFIKSNKWAYFEINTGDKILSRAICVLELVFESYKYYVIELQPKGTDRFSMGIICLTDASKEMDSLAFKTLKEKIIKEKGIFKNINSTQFKVQALKHYSERSTKENEENIVESTGQNIHKSKKQATKKHDPEKYNIEMAKNIIRKIKSIK